jgi:hypothetical protein
MSEALAPFSKLIGKGVQGIVDAIVLTHKIEDLDKDSSITHI